METQLVPPESTAKSILINSLPPLPKPPAAQLAFASVFVWALSGPLFHFFETWQLVITTSTSIITFLMVFLIQNRVAGASAEQRLDLRSVKTQ